MAQTPSAVQTALGTGIQNARITAAREIEPSDSTLQRWFVVGNADVAGRERWITTTASDDAATQAAAILTALRA